MKSRFGTGGLVYSTESGRMCPDCRQPLAQCACKLAQPRPAGDGIVRVSRETKGRGGKTIPPADIPRLVKAAAALRELAPSQSRQPAATQKDIG